MDQLGEQQNDENLTVPLIDSGRQDNQSVAPGDAPMTAAQDAVLSQFLEITHCSVADARGMLVACDWNLENALAVHLADDNRGGQSRLAGSGNNGIYSTDHLSTHDTESRQRPPRTPQARGSTASTPPVDTNSSQGGTSARTRGSTTGTAGERLLGGGEQTSGSIADSIARFFSVLFTILRDLIYAIFAIPSPNSTTGTAQTAPNAAIPENPFHRYFKNQYGTGTGGTPNFYAGNLDEALKAARAKHVVLVAYVHSDLSRATELFCNHTLRDPQVLALLNDSSKFLFWASWESRTTAAAFNCRTYPYFAVVDPSGYSPTTLSPRVDSNALLAALEGDSATLDAVLAALLAGMVHVEELGHALGHNGTPRTGTSTGGALEATRALMEDQDHEFQQALRLDNQKAELKKEEARVARLKLERQELRKSRKRARATKMRIERKRIAEQFQAAEGSSAEDGSVRKTKICVLLPEDNTRLQHEFKYTDTLQHVYNWASALRYLKPDLVRSSRAVPLAFALASRISPNLEKADRSQTLDQLSLVPNAVLLLRKCSTGTHNDTTGTANNTTGTANNTTGTANNTTGTGGDSAEHSEEDSDYNAGTSSSSSEEEFGTTGNATENNAMSGSGTGKNNTGTGVKSGAAQDTGKVDWRL